MTLTLRDYSAQNTRGIAGLSNQLCFEAMEMGYLEKVEHPKIKLDSDSLVHCFLQPMTVKALLAVCNDSDLKVPIVLTTAFRTLAQQYVLKRNLLTIVAPVGRSDHGSGRSLDVANYSECHNVLRRHGFTQSYGRRDPVHYDASGVPDNRSLAVLAFQRLYNLNYPNSLEEDGSVGIATMTALGRSPANGFPIASIPRWMQLDDRGKDIGKLQFKLRELGFYKFACDGVFGSGTQKAVIDYQIANRLSASGIAGEKTLKLLGLYTGD